MKRFSGLAIFDLSLVVLLIVIYFVLHTFLESDIYWIVQIISYTIFCALIIVSIILNSKKKKNNYNSIMTDLEPERVMDYMLKHNFMYSQYERENIQVLAYRLMEKFDLALDILLKEKRDIIDCNYAEKFLHLSNLCSCYIGVKNQEQALQQLNVAKDLMKNVKSNSSTAYSLFFLDLMEHLYCATFDDSYSDYEYFERLLNPNMKIAPPTFYSNINILYTHYTLATIYLRLGMIDRANANFKYVADNGKNLPKAIRARDYLVNGVTEGL